MTASGARRQLRPTDVKRLNRTWRRRAQGRVALILESVTQPFNIGSILRSGAVFGVDYLWVTGNSTLPTHPSAGKTALGAERLVPWAHLATPVEAIAEAKDEGYRVVALELTGDAIPLHEAPLTGDVCLLLGAEDHGCSPAALAACDAVAYIPQIGRIGSLNVAVAAAVALAEVRRREWEHDPPPAGGPDPS